MTATVHEDGLPAFLPTAPPPQSSAASSTVGTDIDGAMEQLSINGNNNNNEQPAPPVMSTHQTHPLPPRPQMARPYSHPMAPSNDMAHVNHPNPPNPSSPGAPGPALAPMHPVAGDHPPQQPPWTTAYPLPPVFAAPGPPPVPLDALGLVYGLPGPRPMYPMCLPPYAHTPVPPRPHPYLTQPVLYVSFVPADMVADDFDSPLRRQGISAISVRLPDAVKPVNRAYPDAYYSWMTKNGCLQFQSLHDAEKALSILVSHPFFAFKNVLVSPLPPPNLCPLPPAPVAPRIIRPIKLANSEQVPAYPQSGALWDFVRPWGSIREVSVSLEESQVPDGQPGQGECRWRATVQFWYEEEAQRFETSYPNSGPFLGWEIEVRRDPSYIPMAPLPFQQPMGPLAHPPMGPPFAVAPPMEPPHFSSPPTMPRQFSSPPMPDHMPLGPDGTPAAFHPMPMPMLPEGPYMYPTPDMNVPRMLPPMMMNPDVAVSPNGVLTPLSPISPGPVLPGPPPEAPLETNHALGVNYIPHPGPFAPGTGERMPPLAGSMHIVAPPSPPNIPVPRYIPPWAAQNGGASLPMSPPYVPVESLPHDLPPHPQSPPQRGRNDWIHKGGKNWREVHGGIVSEDGHVIQHIPNRPPHMSPKKGHGGRGSHSGPVDFCCLMVKNLAPDVSAVFLTDQFSRFGHVTQVRIIRDAQFRSRGFGYVTFQLPDDAANALTHMQNQELAGRRLNISYHDRRNYSNGGNRGFPTNRGRGGHRGSFVQRDWPNKEAGSSESSSDRVGGTPPPAPAAPRHAPTGMTAPMQKRPETRPDVSVSAPSRLQPHSVPATGPTDGVKVSYENVTVDSLADMAPSKTLAILTGGGNDLLAKLHLQKQPTPPHGSQSPQPKKVSIIGAINKIVLHGPTGDLYSPSRVVACIRDFVNNLDDQDEAALSELLHYPAIINAMVMHKLKGFKSPRPPLQALPV